MKAKPEDVNMEPVGFRITRILTDYAQKLPGHCSGIKRITTSMDRNVFVLSSQVAGPLCLQVPCQFDHQ